MRTWSPYIPKVCVSSPTESSKPIVEPKVSHWLIARLVKRTACWGIFVNSVATSVARTSDAPTGTSSVTRPIRSASTASIQSPVIR